MGFGVWSIVATLGYDYEYWQNEILCGNLCCLVSSYLFCDRSLCFGYLPALPFDYGKIRGL